MVGQTVWQGRLRHAIPTVDELRKPGTAKRHNTTKRPNMTGKIAAFHKRLLNSLWPCVAFQLQETTEGEHQHSHCGHASLCKWWLRGNTGAHNLAMPCLASDDSGTTPVHAMWPCLAVQVKHIVWFTLSGHGFLGNHWPRGSTGRRPVRKKDLRSGSFFWFPLRECGDASSQRG